MLPTPSRWVPPGRGLAARLLVAALLVPALLVPAAPAEPLPPVPPAAEPAMEGAGEAEVEVEGTGTTEGTGEAEAEADGERQDLRRRLRQVLRDAARGLSGDAAPEHTLRRTRELFEPVRRVVPEARAAGEAGGAIDAAERAEAMFVVLEDLWARTMRLASRDLSLPCDELQQAADAFNAAAGTDLVRPTARRPRGICLFCGNVCPIESAERLLREMRTAVGRVLAEGVVAESGEQEPAREPEDR